MSFTVMSDVPNPIFDSNGNPFSGAVLKAFLPGTTTSTSIFIDSAGSSPQASITYNAEGKLEVSGNEILPYIDKIHKWGIFANATDATANTPFYMGAFDNVVPIPDLISTSTARTFDTVADMIAATDLTVGRVVETSGYTAEGDGGNNRYEIVDAGTGGDDGGSFINLDTHQAKGLFPGRITNERMFGALGVGGDDTTAIEQCIIFSKGVGGYRYEPTAGIFGFDKELVNPTFGLYINAPLTMIGAGQNRTVFKNLSNNAAGIRCAGADITMQGFTLDQNGSGGTGFQQGGQHTVTRDIIINNQGGVGAFAYVADGSTNAVCENVVINNATNGASFGPTLPTNYMQVIGLRVEPVSGVAVKLNVCANLRFFGLYMEPFNTAGNINNFVEITNCSEVDFYTTGMELGGTHTLIDLSYISIINSRSINFNGVRINHEGTASKSIFRTSGTTMRGTAIENVNIQSTKTGMKFLEIAGTGEIGHSVKNIVIDSVSAMAAVTNTAASTNLTIDNIVDNNAVSTYALNAVNLLAMNIMAPIASTTQAAQTFINCTGGFTGTSSSSGNGNATFLNSNETLHNQTTLDVNCLRLESSSAAYTSQCLFQTIATTGSTGWNLILSNNLAGTAFRVQGNGDVQNTNNSYGAISDPKLKDFLGEAGSQWDDVRDIKFYKYTLKNDDTKLVQLGVNADEAQQVSPALVYETEDIAIDEDGNEYKTGGVTKGFKYSVHYSKAIVALQEAMDRIETLESKVDALEPK